jgi:hypothetical protein
VVAETLAERQRIHQEDIDAVVLIATILTSFGIEEEDRRELRADFQHLRRWRKSVEQAQSYTFEAVITVIVTGLVEEGGRPIWCGGRGSMGAGQWYFRQGDTESETMLQVIVSRFVMGWPPAVPNLALATPSSK